MTTHCVILNKLLLMRRLKEWIPEKLPKYIGSRKMFEKTSKKVLDKQLTIWYTK